MDSLGHVASWDLDDFYSEHLQPDQEFLRRAGEEIEHIYDFLKRRCFQDAPWSGVKVLKVVKGGSLGKGTSMKNGTADLELFLNIFRSYTDEEKEREKIIEEVERCLRISVELHFSRALRVLFSDLIKIYKAQKKKRQMIIEEIARRIDQWQKQPYLSDADLELFSNIFKSYADQEKDWMMLIEVISRKLNELFFSHPDWDLLWDLIKRDQERDQRKIIEETERRVNNRQMKPYLSDADLELFLNIFKSYTDQEKERKKIIKQIARCFNISMVLQFSHALQVLFSDLIKIYKDQKKEWQMIIEEIARRIDQWQKQPYLSDADLELFSNIFKSYTDQEKNWMMFIEVISRELNEFFLSHRDWDLLWDLIKSYTDQEKNQKKIIEETERRVNNRQMKPYLSDADLVLFLNIFRSYTDQEKDRKGIIEEIERRLDEWQKEPYKLSVDVRLLLDLLEIYRDLEKDPEEITQKIRMWLCECKKELYLSDADLVQFNNIFNRYLNLENDRMKIIKEIKWWRNKGWLEPYFSTADLRFLFNLYKRYKDKKEDRMMIIEEIAKWQNNDQGKPYLSDADLVILLDLLKRYTEKEEEQKMIFKETERWFNQCKENMRLELIFEKSKWPNPRVLQFKLRFKKSVDFIDFDILPAYDALGQYDGSRPDPQIYIDLIRTGKCGEFSSCFTELQRDFIVNRPTKLKSLICLVKYWYKEVQEKPFPPKYALELLTVYAWEQGSGQDQFDTAEGLRTVLWLIEHYKEIRIYWTKYYDFDNEIIKQYLQDQLRKNRPVILDPADPTANLGEAKGWDRLAEQAKSYTSMNCSRKRDGSLVEPWNVPLAKEVPWGMTDALYDEETLCGLFQAAEIGTGGK